MLPSLAASVQFLTLTQWKKKTITRSCSQTYTSATKRERERDREKQRERQREREREREKQRERERERERNREIQRETQRETIIYFVVYFVVYLCFSVFLPMCVYTHMLFVHLGIKVREQN
jgi:Flp pilus assembly protein TadB